MISRADLEAGRVREWARSTTLAPLVLTDAQLDASLTRALAAFGEGDVWLFGYGSLIWNPMVHHVERRPAMLHGFHRGFYLRSRINRGTPERPGLVLALDRGGACCGVAFRIPRDAARNELRMLWQREMLLGSYTPRRLRVRAGDELLHALAFVIDRASTGYAGKLTDDEIVARIRAAQGLYGSGEEYLVQTADGLLAHGIRDERLLRIVRLLKGES